TDEDGQPIKYPSWQKTKSGNNIGGQQVPEFNFCKHGIEVTRDGEYYVIKPYKQYYDARWYAYNHWNVGGDNNISFGCLNFNTGGMQPGGQKLYGRKEPLRIKGNQFALCVESGRLEFVPGDKVDVWAKAAEAGEDASKYAILTVDLVLLISA